MKTKKRLLSILLSLVMVLGLMPGISLTAQAGSSEGTAADLVVYGKIFTSENGKVAEAFAVKDGKYVYVGDKAGVGEKHLWRLCGEKQLLMQSPFQRGSEQ